MQPRWACEVRYRTSLTSGLRLPTQETVRGGRKFSLDREGVKQHLASHQQNEHAKLKAWLQLCRESDLDPAPGAVKTDSDAQEECVLSCGACLRPTPGLHT